MGRKKRKRRKLRRINNVSTKRPLTGLDLRKKDGMWNTINEDSKTGIPVEVFLRIGKAGVCAASQTESIGRLISVCISSGVILNVLVKQLGGISCHSHAGYDTAEATSCADAVAKTIKEYLEDRNSLFLPQEMAKVA